MRVTKMAHKDLQTSAGDFANPRKHPGSLKELSEDIAENSLAYPLHVWKTKDEGGKDAHVIVDGSRRFRAIGELLKKKDKRVNGLGKGIPVIVHKAKSAAEARGRAIALNEHRKANSSYEIAESMAEMEELGMQRQEIAETIGKSKTWVTRILKSYHKGTEEVKEAWEKGKLTNELVQEITKHDEPTQNKQLKKLMDHLESGGKDKPTREGRSKARKVATGDKKDPAPKRPTTAQLDRYIGALEKKKLSKYLQGVRDALEFANGIIGPAEFGPELVNLMGDVQVTTDRKPSGKK